MRKSNGATGVAVLLSLVLTTLFAPAVKAEHDPTSRITMNKTTLYEGLVDPASNTPAGFGCLFVKESDASEPVDVLIGVFNGNQVSSAVLRLGDNIVFSGDLYFETTEKKGIVYHLVSGKIRDMEGKYPMVVNKFSELKITRGFSGTPFLSGQGRTKRYLDPFVFSRFNLFPGYQGISEADNLSVTMNNKGLKLQAKQPGMSVKINLGALGSLQYAPAAGEPLKARLNFPGGGVLKWEELDGLAAISLVFSASGEDRKMKILTFPYLSDLYAPMTSHIPVWDNFTRVSVLQDNYSRLGLFDSSYWTPVIQDSLAGEGILKELSEQAIKTTKGYVSTRPHPYLPATTIKTTNEQELVPFKDGYYVAYSGAAIGNHSIFTTLGQDYAMSHINLIRSPAEEGFVKINSNELIIISKATIQVTDYPTLDGDNVVFDYARLDPRLIKGPFFEKDFPFPAAEGTRCELKDGVTYSVPASFLGGDVNCRVTCTTKYWATPRIVDLFEPDKVVVWTVHNGTQYGDPYPPYRIERTMTFRFNLNELAQKTGLSKQELAIRLYQSAEDIRFGKRNLGSAIWKAIFDSGKDLVKKLAGSNPSPLKLMYAYRMADEIENAISVCTQYFDKASSLSELYERFIDVYPLFFPNDTCFKGNEPYYFLNGIYCDNPVLLYKGDGSASKLFGSMVARRNAFIEKGETIPDGLRETFLEISRGWLRGLCWDSWDDLVSFRSAYPDVLREKENTVVAEEVDGLLIWPDFDRARSLHGRMESWDDDRKALVVKGIESMTEAACEELRGYIIDDWNSLNTGQMAIDLKAMSDINNMLKESGSLFAKYADDAFVKEAEAALALLEGKNGGSTTFDAGSPFAAIAYAIGFQKTRKLIDAERNHMPVVSTCYGKEAVFRFFGYNLYAAKPLSNIN